MGVEDQSVANLANEKLNDRDNADKNQLGKVYLRGMDPRKTFYMVMSVGNLDGSLDEPCGVEAMTHAETDAVAVAEQVNASYPTLDMWVYKCVPIAKVWRGKTRVTRFSK